MALREAALTGDAELSRAAERMFRSAMAAIPPVDEADGVDDESA